MRGYKLATGPLPRRHRGSRQAVRRRCCRRAHPNRWRVQRDGVQPQTSKPERGRNCDANVAKQFDKGLSGGNGAKSDRGPDFAPTNCNKFFGAPGRTLAPRLARRPAQQASLGRGFSVGAYGPAGECRFSSKALLRQPGGFEGLLARLEQTEADDLRVLEVPEGEEVPLASDPAALARSSLAEDA